MSDWFEDNFGGIGETLDHWGRGEPAGTVDYSNIFTVVPRLIHDNYASQTKQDESEKDQKRLQQLANQDKYRLQQIQDAQGQIAKHYGDNRAKYTGLLQNAETKPLRADMSRRLADNKLDMVRRGLFKSGIEQRNSADIMNKYRSDYVAGMDRGSTAFNDIYNDALDSALGTGFAMSDIESGAQENAFREALARRQSQNELSRGVGQAGGSAIGSAIGYNQELKKDR